MPDPISRPVFSYEQLRNVADRFLGEFHPSEKLPIPIEEIIDVRFQIDIIPVPGLHQDIDIDAFITSDGTEIYVDEFVYESRPTRYRFSLAHELAHLVLHRDILDSLQVKSIKSWKSARQRISIDDYSWIEWQAYALAGLILVPQAPLAHAVKGVITLARQHGIPTSQLTDASKRIIAREVASRFEVSPECVGKRIEKDGLW